MEMAELRSKRAVVAARTSENAPTSRTLGA
jgi:hypothetical protein